MSKIFEEFSNLVHGRKYRKARGYTNICCPACGDQRYRGGFLPTETGGFRYSCFNGGCPYNLAATGWEPGSGLIGRTRDLFEMLGGNIHNIPFKDRLRRDEKIYDKNGNLVGTKKTKEVAYKFPEVDLPADTDYLADAIDYDDRALEVAEYLDARSPLLIESDYPFLWSPEHPYHYIVPFQHYERTQEKIVGYMGRNIKKSSGADRFIQRAPRDYMFQQHLLFSNEYKYVFVVESPVDAILLRGVATRSNRLSAKQINLLNQCGRKPVLIPDLKDAEYEPYLKAAKDNDWHIAVPDWQAKDPGESITKNGLLWTIEAITSSMTKDYRAVRFALAKG